MLIVVTRIYARLHPKEMEWYYYPKVPLLPLPPPVFLYKLEPFIPMSTVLFNVVGCHTRYLSMFWRHFNI